MEGVTVCVTYIPDNNENNPTVRKRIMERVTGSFKNSLNLGSTVITRQTPEKVIKKSSNLIATSEPGIRKKGNFGYKGIPINIAATEYLIIPSSHFERFSI